MGTTLTAMQAGSMTSTYTCAIEGYKYLICNGETAAAVTAWAGTDFADAITNAAFKISNRQSFHPWAPFQGGGTAEIWVQPDATDRFGIDVHRTNAGAETQLSLTADRNDTTLTVLDTSLFASSGEAFIGNECFAYTSTTATTFVTSARGKYCPFGVDGGTRFAQHHRVGAVDYGVNIQPAVTANRRTWIGARVGIWEHRVVAGVLDTKAQAQLVFAGKIAEIRTDPNTGWTVVQLEHVLDEIKNATLLRDQYKAKIQEGAWLTLNKKFSASDSAGGSGLTATDLVVVSGAPASANEVQEGYYTCGEIASVITNWLAAELTAARLHVTVSVMSAYPSPNGGYKTFINYTFAGATATTVCAFSLRMPGEIAMLLGLQDSWSGSHLFQVTTLGSVLEQFESPSAPLYTLAGAPSNPGWDGPEILLGEETGTFFDNYAMMPLTYRGMPLKPPISNSYEWGLFLLAGSYLMLGARVTSGGDTYIYYATIYEFDGIDKFRWGTVDPSGITVVQIAAISYGFGNLLRRLFYSSGTSTYNHATYDSLSYGLGLNIPGALLGDDFEASCVGSVGYQVMQPVWLAKPMKLSEAIGADLVLRGQFLVWKNGALRFSQWSTPAVANSVATLDETNKAEPAGNRAVQRSATVITKEWAKPVVKIAYDYDWKADKFGASPMLIEDRAAIDDDGGDPVTISCRNLDEAQLSVLLSEFMARLPMVSRPMHKIRRSIDSRYYEGYAPGDTVLITDADARDPTTGIRGITARPALIIGHSYDPGGSSAGGGVQDMSGEVDLFLVPVERTGVYSPCAQVDDTAANSGYDAGTGALTCYAHEHSESTAAADASNFAAGDKIRVIEIDPADPASPTTWTRTIDTVVGNVITPTATLSAPAWDSTLKYRIISDAYSTAVTTQEVDAYQADDANGLLNSAVQPYTYGIPQPAAYTVETVQLAELHATLSYGDQKPRDVGYDRGLIRTINNLIDFKTAHQSPSLDATVRSGVGTTGTYRLLMIRELFTGAALYSSVSRDLYVSPWFRSSDGGSATIRVTLLKTMPVDSSIDDVTRQLPYSEATWTTSSTTWQTGTRTALSLSVSSIDGFAWLLIEGTAKCETRGLASCFEVGRA